MRYLNGLLGTFVGLVIASFAVNLLVGVNPNFVGLIGVNLVFAAIGAAIVAVVEKSSWGWGKYAVAGALTSGLLQFAALVGMLLLFASAYGRTGEVMQNIFVLVGPLLSCAIMGAVGGLGYRQLAGAKAAAQ